MATKDQLSDEIVRILRSLRVADPDRHTVLARDLAEAIISLREHFLTPEGRPDWTGRTWQYRAALRELYAQAGYSPTERSATQNTVRYHVGNLMRQRLSAAELEAAGISAPSPRQRQAARRKRAAALVAATLSPLISSDGDDGGDERAIGRTKIKALRDVLATLANFRVHKRRAANPDLLAFTDTMIKLLEAIRDRASTLIRELERARPTGNGK